MLIPVGNMNDKKRESMQIQVLPTRLTGVQCPPPSLERRRLRGAGKKGGGGDRFVKGISIQTAKHQENNFKKRFIVQ